MEQSKKDEIMNKKVQIVLPDGSGGLYSLYEIQNELGTTELENVMCNESLGEDERQKLMSDILAKFVAKKMNLDTDDVHSIQNYDDFMRTIGNKVLNKDNTFTINTPFGNIELKRKHIELLAQSVIISIGMMIFITLVNVFADRIVQSSASFTIIYTLGFVLNIISFIIMIQLTLEIWRNLRNETNNK